MRLTRQSEIAIAILAACARRPDAYVHTSVAAAEAGATKAHTSKIVHLLVRVGFLAAARGRRGGLRLARPAETIPLDAVLRHMQPELVEAAEDARRRTPVLAHIDTIVDTARAAFIALMARFTVADLVTRSPLQRIACADCRLLKARCDVMPAAPAHPFQESPGIHAPPCA